MSLNRSSLSTPTENNIHVHDLLTFQQITVVPKARGATLFACDLQVCAVAGPAVLMRPEA